MRDGLAACHFTQWWGVAVFISSCYAGPPTFQPECRLNSDCPTGSICSSGVCGPACLEDRDCAPPNVCDRASGRCVSSPSQDAGGGIDGGTDASLDQNDEGAFGAVGGPGCVPDETPEITIASILSPGTCGPVTQSFCGTYTHSGYAVDIALAVGTTLRAPIAGRVVALREFIPDTCHYTSWDRPGGRNDLRTRELCPYEPTDFGNYVAIAPWDPMQPSVVLAHLRHEGAMVTDGQSVRVGDIIGLSGHTGWSTDPHVHVQAVARGNEYGSFPSVPATFIYSRSATGTSTTGRPITGTQYCGVPTSAVQLLEPRGIDWLAPESTATVRWQAPDGSSVRVIARDVATRMELFPTIAATAPSMGSTPVEIPRDWAGRAIEFCVSASAGTDCGSAIWVPHAELNCEPGPHREGDPLTCYYSVTGIPGGQLLRGVLLHGTTRSELATVSTTLSPGSGTLLVGSLPIGTSPSTIVCVTTRIDDPVPATACAPVYVAPGGAVIADAGTPPPADSGTSDRLLIVDPHAALDTFCDPVSLVTWTSTETFSSDPGQPLEVPADRLSPYGNLLIGARCPATGRWLDWSTLGLGMTARSLGIDVRLRGADLGDRAQVCTDPYSGGAKLSIPLGSGTPSCP